MTPPHRRLVALAGLLMVATLGVLLARRFAPEADCTRREGTWLPEARRCDFGRGGEVVRVLKRSAQCRTLPDSSIRECSYSVDRLRIVIIDVGTAEAGIFIDGADEALGYSAAVFLGAGCVRVAPGTRLKEEDPMRRTEDGFISTWTAAIHESLVGCMMAGRAAREDARAATRAK